MFKKMIALTVMAAFFSVISVAAFPLQAQELPGAVEKAGPTTVQSGGGSILPIVLIGVGVLAVAAVLIFVVFKTSYDIVGTWTFVFTGSTTLTLSFTFTGTKESGTWVINTPVSNANTPAGTSASGPASRLAVATPTYTYTVVGKNVTMAITGVPQIAISGQFTAANTMTGTWIESSKSWSWTATR
jgi:hypothetical protein